MSEEFVDLSNTALNDTFEPTVHPAGEEAVLRIVSFLKSQDKNGNDYMMPFFEIIDDAYAKEFGDYMPLPNAGMSPKEVNKSKLRILSFSKAFDIDFSQPLDIKNDIVGKTGWAILGVKTDQEGEPINSIKKFVGGN